MTEADEIKEPEGIDLFKPDTPVRCIHQFVGGEKTGCDWKGLFKELVVETGMKADGSRIYIRCCPKCDCPFVVSSPHLRKLGTIEEV